jgi:ferritin-like metal-binding protein YciE
VRRAGIRSECAMKLMSEKLQDLQALYLRQLSLLLFTKEMIQIKTQMLIDSATDVELHQSLRDHLTETDAQAERLRNILTRATGKTETLKGKVIYALFDEAEELIEDAAHEGVRDAIVISAAQRIEHYEIAVYGELRQFAHILGMDEDARLLDQTIQEERRADHQLTTIANRVNLTARKAA